MFHSSTSFSMDMGCPLLRGLSVRRLRRRAATLPLRLERTFPGSTFFSAFWELMAAVRDSVIGRRSSGVRLRIQTFRLGEMSGRPVVARVPSRKCRRQLWYVVSQLLKALTFMGGVEMGDGGDGSGDSGLYCSLLSRVCVIIAIVFKMLKGERQVQVVQAWGNNPELPPKSVWHRKLI